MLDRKGYRYALIGLSTALAVFLIGASTIAAVGHEVPKELWTVGTALGGGLLGVLVPRPQGSAGSKPLAESTAVQNEVAKAATVAAASVPPVAAAAAANAVEHVESPTNLLAAIAASSAGPGAAGSTLAAQHQASADRMSSQAAGGGSDEATRVPLEAQATVYTAAAVAATSDTTAKAAVAAAAAAPSGNVKLWDYVAKMGPPLLVLVGALVLGIELTHASISHESFVEAVRLNGNVNATEIAKEFMAALVRHQQASIKEGEALLALATAAGGALIGVLAPSPAQSKSTTSTS